MDHVRARLDFSKDSESSGSRAATGAAQGGWRTAAEELGEELTGELEEEGGEEERPAGNLEIGSTTGRDTAETGEETPRYLIEFMRSFGQMRANDDGWPVFDGRYVSYPRFKKEWTAYRSTYHSAVSDDLAARTLRNKCLKGEALQMVNHLDDLHEMWDTLNICYERPGKYAEEALQPMVNFRRYKVFDSVAVREFYSLVRAAIRGARKIGRIELLLNDQTIPRIMSKMPPSDWKEWATKGPDWSGQDANLAFEDFIERKWLDAINIAATEPTPGGGEEERAAGRARTFDKAGGGERGAMKLTGAVNTIEGEEVSRPPSPQWDLSFRKRCRARNLIGCDGNHLILQCEKLRGMKLAERREVVERSGLCTFCLRHAAELECYAKGGVSKPRCTRPGYDGEHATKLHALMGEADAEVNIVAGDDGEVVSEYEDEYGHQHSHEYEDLWVAALGATEVSKETVEPADTAGGREPLQGDDLAEGEEMTDQYEYEYESLWVGTIGATEEPGEMDRSTGTATDHGLAQGDDSVKMEEEATGDEQWDLETYQPGRRTGGARDPTCGPPRCSLSGRARAPRSAEAGRPRPKEGPGAASDQHWEEVRYNAWLRQLLSDDSSDGEEDEERYGRFAESGRWMTELYGIPQDPTPTLGRECSA